ncbi:MAG: NAD-dependent epimerase/dehydratase family protein [Bacteroidia bacterium]|nr:NAD-dependent epimerase/dehydratase family protein [Bacteroidia bacterium]
MKFTYKLRIKANLRITNVKTIRKFVEMVFVTGGTGLLGTHVLYELLKSGKQVRALKRPGSDLLQVIRTFSYYTSAPEQLFSKVQWVEGDLDDIYSLLEAMEGVDEVYHCAAIVSFDPKDVQAILKVNIEGTTNVVNAAIEKKIKKFCHVSSIAAIGTSEGSITEETYWKSSPDNSIYSISKYGAEREVWRAAEEGLNVVVVNPSVIIGPGDWKGVGTKMFRTAYNGLLFYTDGVTGFVDARDVAGVMVRLMESKICGQRFIVSSENIGFRKFFELACACFKKPLPSVKAGALLSGIAWRIEKFKSAISGYSPLITKETARAAHKTKYYSNDKVKKALNYNFIPVDESIRETCRLFLLDTKN